LKLFQAQDVTSELKGFFQFVLGYGDVYVQTAGEAQRFVFSAVPNPEKIRNIVIKLVERSKEHHSWHGPHNS